MKILEVGEVLRGEIEDAVRAARTLAIRPAATPEERRAVRAAKRRMVRDLLGGGGRMRADRLRGVRLDPNLRVPDDAPAEMMAPLPAVRRQFESAG